MISTCALLNRGWNSLVDSSQDLCNGPERQQHGLVTSDFGRGLLWEIAIVFVGCGINFKVEFHGLPTLRWEHILSKLELAWPVVLQVCLHDSLESLSVFDCLWETLSYLFVSHSGITKQFCLPLILWVMGLYYQPLLKGKLLLCPLFGFPYYMFFVCLLNTSCVLWHLWL